MTGPASLFKLEIEGADAVTWEIAHVHGTERLHGAPRFVVTTDTRDGSGDVDLDALVTRKATLSWNTVDDTRTFIGVVEEVSRDQELFEIVLVSRVALLADCIDHKVFLEQTAIEIATKVLAEHHIRLDAHVERTLPKRAQCVQAFESDLAFVSRILADEGISWFVSSTEEDVVIASDHGGGYTALPGNLPVVESGGLVDERSVYAATITKRVVPDKVSLGDYNFETPLVELRASAGSGDLEAYEYPGSFTTTEEGRVRAKLRLEELRCKERVLTGQTTARDFFAGCVVSLTGNMEGAEGDWLVLEVEHEASLHQMGPRAGADDDDVTMNTEHARRRFTTTFRATPKATPYRPVPMPAPRVDGVENAITTGPPSQDLHTDKFARVKAQLRWDRLGKKDDKSSTWVRTLQPPTSGGFMLPRVGWEVLLGFFGRSFDAPYVLGRLPNGAAPPPEGLPKGKTMSAFGSLTTPGGGTKNMVRMDDAAGSEAFDVVASYDLNEKTENDKVTQVKGNETDLVGVNRTVIVGQVHSLTVGGAQTHTVGASRDVAVDANMMIKAAAETIMIGGLRMFKVGGDSTIACTTLTRTIGAAKVETAVEQQTRQVTGASTVMVGGSWITLGGTQSSVSVGGLSRETVGGPKSVKTKKDYSLTVKGSLTQTLASRKAKSGSKIAETYEGSATINIDGSAKMKGADIIVHAKDKITLKADGITIEITSSGIEIKGKFEGSVGAIDDGDESYA
jgi:type VI secretion system secreted protein VgrG